jgi:hypothetical protein
MDLSGMSDEEYKRATATYSALIALREKVVSFRQTCVT